MAPAIINLLRGRSDAASLGPLAARSILLARDPSGEHNDPTTGAIRPQEINNNAVFAIFGLLGAAFVIVGIWFFFWAKNGGFYFKKGDWEDYKSTVLRRKGPNGTIYSDATPSTVLGGGSIYKDVDDHTTTTGDDLTTVVSATTGITGITGITGGVSDISGREKRRKKREQKEREKERRREEKAREKEERKKKSRRKVDADGVIVDEEAEQEAKEHLRSYRHEKPARVGGINREADGSQWDGSTNPSWSTMSPSHAAPSSVDSGSTVTDDLMGNRQRTPTSTPTKKDKTGGIRKVYSTADKNAMRENERIRAEARRLQEKGRAAAAAAASTTNSSSNLRRDFSFIRGADETMALRRIEEAPIEESVASGPSYATEDFAEKSAPPEYRARTRSRSRRRSAAPPSTAPSDSRVPGSWVESEVGSASDVGTKVYTHSHHIPVGGGSSVSGVSSVTGTGSELSYAEEKRKKRGGAGARRARE
ncbi:hypothetical protein VTI74DRAFT_1603 [Chaetomium olivicolor]